MRNSRSLFLVLCGAILTGCGDGTGPTIEPPLDCSAASTRSLQIGQFEILDPNSTGACVRLPAAGSSGAEHLYIPLATAGQETPDGVSAPYLLSGTAVATASAPQLPSPRLSAFQRPLPAEAFHSMLRSREKSLAEDGSRALFDNARIATQAAPPSVGEQRTFNVCASSSCTGFVQSTATARSVGDRVAIYVDNAAPAGGYTDTDLDQVKALFDQHLYPIDTVAFGRESDVDGNAVVIVLLTQRVNALSPDCSTTGRIILGYFFGADLLPPGSNNPGSNDGEVFYGLVPDVNNSRCQVSKEEANSKLPATFIHEFQHMISYNQHVLLRHGSSEDTWLNEGLSHFAEELGGREVPDAQCAPTSCAQEFLGQGDLLNALEYLASPEDFYLIEPGSSTGQLEERGANWLFVRWLADHFGGSTVLGTELTRQLLATSQIGSANVAARTGVDFSTLVGEWQLTNYLDDLPGFSPGDSRLSYTSWNFREVGDANGGFPLVPDSTDGTAYGHSGTLRAGSGHHVLVVQPPNAGTVDLRVTGTGGAALPTTIVPRIALVRIR
ncbi:MAG: hypothetical protein ACJ8AQ_03835 [Gemmatimonadales bacterium]